MSEEVWRDIPGYNGLYQASDLGHIRVVRVLKGGYDRGRLTVALSKRRKARSFHIHILVALTFLGPRPDGRVVAHNDGNPMNNRLSNLRYATQRENYQDSVRHGTAYIGTRNWKSKLTEPLVLAIRAACGEQASIAKKYGIAQCTVSQIKARLRWRHVA